MTKLFLDLDDFVEPLKNLKTASNFVPMKYFIIFLFLISFVGFILPPAFSTGENFFYGTTTFERLPTAIIPSNPTEFEIKFHYTSGSYVLETLLPIIEVSPEGAKSKVHFDVEPVSAYQNDIVRIPVTITVDPSIEYEKIFLSISYAGISLRAVPLKGSWSDSIIFDIDHDGTNENSSSANNDEKIIMSPLKQFKSGISIDEIQCKDNLLLVIKSSNNMPACVKPDTKQKLVERGWAKPNDSMTRSFTYQIESFDVSTTITNGSINKIIKLDHANSIFIEISSFDRGYLIIKIPRTMLTALNDDYSKFEFFVLSDGEETIYEQIDSETIKINFETNTKEIEIVGTSKVN